MDLPAPAARTLAKLYSFRGSAKPQSLYANPSVQSKKALRGLVEVDLVRIDDGQAELAPKGWIFVTEHVGDVEVAASA